MSWNYRIVRYADGTGYGLHEVYYDDTGAPTKMTAEPCRFVGDSAEDVRGALMRAKMDAVRRPVMDEPATWAPPRGGEGGRDGEGRSQ